MPINKSVGKYIINFLFIFNLQNINADRWICQQIQNLIFLFYIKSEKLNADRPVCRQIYNKYFNYF